MQLQKPIKHFRESIWHYRVHWFYQHLAWPRALDEAEGNSEKGEDEWDVQGGRAAGLWQQIS